MGDFLNLGVNVTVAGLTIVFGMLILLVIIISLFGKIMSSNSSKSKNDTADKPLKTVAPQSEDDEIIAVISAAVAMLYEGSGKTPIVRNIKPVARAARPIWATVGIIDNTRTF